MQFIFGDTFIGTLLYTLSLSAEVVKCVDVCLRVVSTGSVSDSDRPSDSQTSSGQTTDAQVRSPSQLPAGHGVLGRDEERTQTATDRDHRQSVT